MSKKKNILNESTIRRFMKLADIDALSEDYFSVPDVEEEAIQEEEEEMDMGAEEEPMEEPAEMDMGAEEMGGPAEEVSEEAVKEIVDAIADAVSEVTGVSVEAVGGEEPAMEPAEVEVEPEVDELGGEEAFDAEEEVPPANTTYEEGVQADEEEEQISEDSEDENAEEEVVEEEASKQKITNEELVNYVAQKVAARLAEKKA